MPEKLTAVVLVGVKEMVPLDDTEFVRDPVADVELLIDELGEMLTVIAGDEELLPLPDTIELELELILADLLDDDEIEPVLAVEAEDEVDADTELTGVIVIADEGVDVPDAGSVATSNPMDAGGTHNHNGAVGSLQGSA